MEQPRCPFMCEQLKHYASILWNTILKFKNKNVSNLNDYPRTSAENNQTGPGRWLDH